MSEKMFRFFVFWRFCFECSSEMGKEINYLVMAILLIGMALLLGGDTDSTLSGRLKRRMNRRSVLLSVWIIKGCTGTGKC